MVAVVAATVVVAVDCSSSSKSVYKEISAAVQQEKTLMMGRHSMMDNAFIIGNMMTNEDSGVIA